MNDFVLQYYDVENNIDGSPQLYKDIYIFPLFLKDFKYYTKLNTYFTLAKHYIPDKEILKMSMLKFILYIYQQEMNFQLRQSNINIINAEKDIIELLKYIIKPKEGILKDIVFSYDLRNKDDNIINNYKDLNLKLKINICIVIQINNEENVLLLNEQDFDNIREIILEQNGISIEYINQFDPTLEENLIFFYRTTPSATFEDQIFSFGEIMKMHPKEIRDNFTFYQFKKYIDRINIRMNYELFKPLENSGQISVKNGTIDHWLSPSLNKGRYDDILVAKDNYVKENDIFKVSQQK